jgi:transcriptional regulator NrdR family protein
MPRRRPRECPPCPFCGHEQGFKLKKKRAPRLAALRHRWRCAACGSKFSAWETTTRPPVKKEQNV